MRFRRGSRLELVLLPLCSRCSTCSDMMDAVDRSFVGKSVKKKKGAAIRVVFAISLD